MSLNFNKDIFTALSSGTGFQSSTTPLSENALTKAIQIRNRIETYLSPIDESEEPLPTVSIADKLGTVELALMGYENGVLSLQLHLTTRIDGFLEDMQIAAAIKEIDSYIEQVPASCANINTIAGTLAGATDMNLDSTIVIMLDLESGFDALDSAIDTSNTTALNLALENLETKLDTLANDLTTQISYLEDIIAAEAEMLTNMYETHKSMASTFALQSLLEDECVKGLITQLAGDTLKTAIENELEEALKNTLSEP